MANQVFKLYLHVSWILDKSCLRKFNRCIINYLGRLNLKFRSVIASKWKLSWSKKIVDVRLDLPLDDWIFKKWLDGTHHLVTIFLCWLVMGCLSGNSSIFLPGTICSSFRVQRWCQDLILFCFIVEHSETWGHFICF